MAEARATNRSSGIHSLVDHYLSTGDGRALALAVRKARRALQTATGPDRPDRMRTLCLALRYRFHQTRDRGCLEEALPLARGALALIGSNHPDRPLYLHTLSNLTSHMYTLTKQGALLSETLRAGREALETMPEEHPDRPHLLADVAVHLADLYDVNQDPKVLDSAILLARTSATALPAGGVPGACARNTLANLLGLKFEATRDQQFLFAALTHGSAAAKGFPETSPLLGGCLHRLGQLFDEWYGVMNMPEALRTGLQFLREAAALRPSGDPQLPDTWNDLGVLSAKWHQVSSDPGALLEAIRAGRRAVRLAPPGHPGRALYLTYLSCHLSAQFMLTSRRSWLRAAVTAARTAVEESSDSAQERSRCLSNLGNRLSEWYVVSRRAKVLSEALACARLAAEILPETDPERPDRLNNLANRLSDWYGVSGDPNDLAEALEYARAALVSAANPHPDRPTYLANLSNRLSEQYEHTGDAVYLDEAIQMSRQAVETAPPKSIDRVTYLSNLSGRLVQRYQLAGNRQDLTEAIALGETALAMLPADHLRRPMLLSNLGRHLGSLFALTGDPQALRRAVECDLAAVKAATLQNVMAPGYLNNLSAHLSDYYLTGGPPEALSRAITYLNEAIGRTASRHPVQASRLSNLGMLHVLRFRRDGDIAALSEAIACGRKAVQIQGAGPIDRARSYAQLALSLGERYTATGEIPHLHEAIRSARLAVRVADRCRGEVPPMLLRRLNSLLAALLMERGTGRDWQNAHQAISMALAQQQTELGRQRGERDMMDYLRSKDDVYQLAVACRLELARRAMRAGGADRAAHLAEQAWTAAEEGKGRAFAALLASDREALATGAAEITAAAPAPLSAVQDLLPPGAVLLELYPLPVALAVFVISRSGLAATTVPLPSQTLADWTENLDRAVQATWRRAPRSRSQTVAAVLARLGSAMEPALRQLLPAQPKAGPADVVPELLVLPTGVLHRWPLHLLPYADGILWDYWAVSYLPTADTLLHCAARQPERGHSPLLLAPDLTLPGAAAEAVLAATAGWQVAVGEAATLETLQAHSGPFALATHVEPDLEDGSSSRIRLWTAEGPGWVSAREMLRLLARRQPAEHAELGACAAHMEAPRQGDHLQGLTRSLLAAGLRSLSTTLWYVDDVAACYIGGRFRERSEQGNGSKASWLRQAALELRAGGWRAVARWLSDRSACAPFGKGILHGLQAECLLRAGDVAGFIAQTDAMAAADGEYPWVRMAVAQMQAQYFAHRESLAAVMENPMPTQIVRPEMQMTLLHWGAAILVGYGLQQRSGTGRCHDSSH